MTVQEDVVTRYSAVTRPFESAMGGLASAAARGRDAISQVTSAINPLTIAVGALGIGGIASKVIELNNQFENTQRTIAGTLSALGVVTGANPLQAFQNGLVASERTMLAINTAAAALPGEASEYVQVFQTALPDIQAAIGNNVEGIYGFTNQLTAIGRTFGIDAAQIGADARRLFAQARGGAGADVATFNRLLPFLRSVEGQAGLTADSFNRMTNVERIDLFRQAMGKLQPMMDDASSSWDSQVGALTSVVEMVIRLGGQPLFDHMKDSVAGLNAMFVDTNGNLTGMGQRIVGIGNMISRAFVQGFRTVGTVIEVAQSSANRLFATLERSGVLAYLRNGAGNLMALQSMLPSIAENVMGENNMGVGIAGLEGMITSVINDAAQTFENLTQVVRPTVNLLSTMAGVVLDLGSVALPMLTSVANTLLDVLLPFWASLADIVSTLLTKVRPGFMQLWQGISAVVRGVVTFLAPVMRLLARVITFVVSKIVDFLAPAINAIVGVFGIMLQKIGEFLEALGRWIGSITEETAANEGVQDRVNRQIDERNRRLRDAAGRPPAAADGAPSAANAPATPGARGGGGRATMDARFSRFEITQKFEEGFDPDRIAIAFVRDISSLGQQRLQSGLEPTFGTV